MSEPIIFFSLPVEEFYKNIKALMIEVVEEKITQEPHMPDELAEKTLLLPKEVCKVLRISSGTLHNLVKEGKLTGFKIQRRRYFARTDIEKMMKRQFG